MTQILDLSDLVGPPRRIKLGPNEYLLPRDLNVELYLRIVGLAEHPEELEENVVVRQLRDEVLELFRVHQPEMQALPPAVSIPVLVQLIGRVYSGAEEVPPQKAAPKPRAPRKVSPGTSTARAAKPRTRSRSSSS
jgi:cell division septation protein DedD